MESKPAALLNLCMINEGLGQKSLSDEKLELRLGPPATDEVDQPDQKVVKNGFKFQYPTNPPSCSQKRVAPPSMIGWPPVRSFRKKMAASSSPLKPSLDPKSEISKEEDKGELKTSVKDNSCSASKGQMFVKINMDGVPIGRKVNLMKYDSYESLSSAVDQLFRCLLLAQGSGGEINLEEYTLVYEDNEGDRVLVGDVPWSMFLSTVKRLRVLKKSKLGVKHG